VQALPGAAAATWKKNSSRGQGWGFPESPDHPQSMRLTGKVLRVMRKFHTTVLTRLPSLRDRDLAPVVFAHVVDATELPEGP
jgi:hypothetical protein